MTGREIKVVSKIHKNVSELTVDDIAVCCDRNGITVDSLCGKLKELLNATREIKDRDGDLIDTIPDNNIQLKALTVALELLKLVGGKKEEIIATVQHHMAPGDIDRLEVIAKELKGLEIRLETEPVQKGTSIDADFTVI